MELKQTLKRQKEQKEKEEKIKKKRDGKRLFYQEIEKAVDLIGQENIKMLK